VLSVSGWLARRLKSTWCSSVRPRFRSFRVVSEGEREWRGGPETYESTYACFSLNHISIMSKSLVCQNRSHDNNSPYGHWGSHNNAFDMGTAGLDYECVQPNTHLFLTHYPPILPSQHGVKVRLLQSLIPTLGSPTHSSISVIDGVPPVPRSLEAHTLAPRTNLFGEAISNHDIVLF
jgi:hypothetical protein